MTLADGTRHVGYLTPSAAGGTDLSSRQPAIVAADGQVPFRRGMPAPRPEDLSRSCALLERASPAEVSSTRFESDVSLVGGPVMGVVPGFLILEDFNTMRTEVVT